IVPLAYFGDNKFHAVNTMQPPYQPSANPYASTDATHLYADRARANTLPPQTAMTVGDQLTAAGVSWAWCAGAWNDTATAATGAPPGFRQPFGAGVRPNFQFHHQPFNSYTRFDPTTGAAERTAHLKDYTDLVAAADAGTLPAVAFYKPEGDLNQHP